MGVRLGGGGRRGGGVRGWGWGEVRGGWYTAFRISVSDSFIAQPGRGWSTWDRGVVVPGTGELEYLGGVNTE